MLSFTGTYHRPDPSRNAAFKAPLYEGDHVGILLRIFSVFCIFPLLSLSLFFFPVSLENKQKETQN